MSSSTSENPAGEPGGPPQVLTQTDGSGSSRFMRVVITQTITRGNGRFFLGVTRIETDGQIWHGNDRQRNVFSFIPLPIIPLTKD